MSAEQRELVTTTELPKTQPKRVLLEPKVLPAREGRFYNRIAGDEDILPILNNAYQSPVVAVDLETKGADYSDPNTSIVGIGLAWHRGSAYLPITELSNYSRFQIHTFLNNKQGLVAHNVYFDGGYLYRELFRHPQWLACTYGLTMQLSNEGWLGQRWGLKELQISLLGWAEANDKELDEWLITNGFYKGNRRKDESREALLQGILEGTLSAEKGEMWRAPKEVLGKYCCLDAESTYLLYTGVLAPALAKFPDLITYHRDEFLYLVRTLIEQKIRGILVDRDKLLSLDAQLTLEIEQTKQQFRTDPLISSPIYEIETRLLSELFEKQPEQYLKQKPVPTEPPKHKKDGSVSKNYLRWKELLPTYQERTLSKNWINWRERMDKAEAGLDPDYQFNINSQHHLRELLYTRLGLPVKIETETGEPSTSMKALRTMGPMGALLVRHIELVKEKGFTTKYLELTSERPTIHASFRTPGTVTGRLSSREPNLQQIPKSKRMMELFIARPGHVWLDLDFSALEPVVTTEYSQDPNLLFIYGDTAPKNDIYLFVGANIPGEIGRKIRGTGYDPYNPTPEALARAKKECKHERGICKTVVLACQYGAGVNKVYNTLEQAEIYLPYEEVEAVWNTYWELFERVRGFSKELYWQWRKQGYVLNGTGRPMCVLPDDTKDLLNRFVQSTGHDVLQIYIRLFTQELNRREIPWTPVIIDWHDASTIEVPEAYVEQAKEVMGSWALDALNRMLGCNIKLRGEVETALNLAEAKQPEA